MPDLRHNTARHRYEYDTEAGEALLRVVRRNRRDNTLHMRVDVLARQVVPAASGNGHAVRLHDLPGHGLDGSLAVAVRQVVRSPGGELLADSEVIHVYRLRDGLIDRMDVEESE